MLAGHTKSHPGFWIHTSGTGILTWRDQRSQTYGEAPSLTPYNDLEGVSALTSLPDEASHRDVDKIVLETGLKNPNVVKTAIVCPPTVYGPGRGPGNQRSRQVYCLVRATLTRGKAPLIGKGLTEWDNVHVHDLSSLFVLLVEAAVVASSSEFKAEIWGQNGYFLAENGHHVWGEVSQWVGDEAFKQGFINTADVDEMSVDEANKFAGFEALSWALNSKGLARRAKRYLGWKPEGKSLKDEIPGIVEGEAKILGLMKGHAQKITELR